MSAGEVDQAIQHEGQLIQDCTCLKSNQPHQNHLFISYTQSCHYIYYNLLQETRKFWGHELRTSTLIYAVNDDGVLTMDKTT